MTNPFTRLLSTLFPTKEASDPAGSQAASGMPESGIPLPESEIPTPESAINATDERFTQVPHVAPTEVPTEQTPAPGQQPAPFELPLSDEAKLCLEIPQFISACAQSVGKTREHNEDALFMLQTVLSTHGENIPMGLFIVADGMGGHRHGEVASGLAVRSVANAILRKIFMTQVTIKPLPPQNSIQEIMESSIEEAHRHIMKEAPGSGTTITAILLLNRHMVIAHVGDSRAYLFKPDISPVVLTRDHSLVMRMMELGQLTQEEAAVHPQRNVLYKALGQGDPFDPDITSSPLPEQGSLLICSDGLWGVVPEAQLVQIIQTTPNPQEACQLMVDAANELGGPDNISAILVHLPQSTS